MRQSEDDDNHHQSFIAGDESRDKRSFCLSISERENFPLWLWRSWIRLALVFAHSISLSLLTLHSHLTFANFSTRVCMSVGAWIFFNLTLSCMNRVQQQRFHGKFRDFLMFRWHSNLLNFELLNQSLFWLRFLPVDGHLTPSISLIDSKAFLLIKLINS